METEWQAVRYIKLAVLSQLRSYGWWEAQLVSKTISLLHKCGMLMEDQMNSKYNNKT